MSGGAITLNIWRSELLQRMSSQAQGRGDGVSVKNLDLKIEVGVNPLLRMSPGPQNMIHIP